MKLNYFTDKENHNFNKKELMIEASRGLQACKSTSAVIGILEDIWLIAQKRKI